jgi:hypothetical protein
MAVEGSDPSANTLMDLIAGHRVTAVIYVAAKLGIGRVVPTGSRYSVIEGAAE